MDAQAPTHGGSSQAYRKPVFDLGMARFINWRDMTGGKLIVKAIRTHVLDDANHRFTRDNSEAFFDEDSHFQLRRPDRSPGARTME